MFTPPKNDRRSSARSIHLAAGDHERVAGMSENAAMSVEAELNQRALLVV